jgi:hypothetical protein
MPKRRYPIPTVCVPWRPSPSRLAPFKRVMRFWEEIGWPVITADSDTEIFSLAQARNNAVAKAATEVVVIADADTIPDIANVRAAVEHPDGVCWPFTRYRIISPEYLDTPFEQLATVPILNTWDGEGIAGVGGCMVTTRAEYWRLGGTPPEFIGWGWEDTAFSAIAATLSHVKRIPGNVYAFEHNLTATGDYDNAVADSPGWDRNRDRNEALMKPYQNAHGRQWLMREILRLRKAGEAGGRPLGSYGYPIGR